MDSVLLEASRQVVESAQPFIVWDAMVGAFSTTKSECRHIPSSARCGSVGELTAVAADSHTAAAGRAREIWTSCCAIFGELQQCAATATAFAAAELTASEEQCEHQQRS